MGVDEAGSDDVAGGVDFVRAGQVVVDDSVVQNIPAGVAIRNPIVK